MNDDVWNPWHGCAKYSEGCQNCYVYRRDGKYGKPSSVAQKTSLFDLPLRHGKYGEFKIPSGSTLFTCMTSDFFLDQADDWRPEIWHMIRLRRDVHFFIITKRIVRFPECIPDDWGEGYPNVSICCTMENQRQCDIRFPVFNSLPIKNKFVTSEPLLTDIDMEKYLNPSIRQVIVGGESGPNARVCSYDWVLHIRQQCINRGVHFRFKQTGAKLLKDGRLFEIQRQFQHQQAKKAGINT